MVNRCGASWIAGAILSLLPVAVDAQSMLEIRGDMAGAPIREIDDPNSGARWLLYAAQDGGPGRLVLVPKSESEPHRTRGVAPIPPKPVIRAGDRIVLEEHTAVVDARLEAIALGTAAPGVALRVRLAIGGRVVPAIALAAGRAEITADQEPQP